MALPRYAPERLQEIAEALNLDVDLIAQIFAGQTVAPPAIAQAIHGVDTRVRLQDLRTSDWATVWPHLRLFGQA